MRARTPSAAASTRTSRRATRVACSSRTTPGTGAISVVAYTYSALFYIKPGYMQPTQGEIEGDVVESYEMSPDKLTLTLKINPNAHFSPQAPVNGRSVDARDVQASWERMKTISSRRGQYLNELNPSAPIVSLTATDDKTVVIKLAAPYSTIYSLLCGNFVGDLFIGPKEAADPKVLDLRTTSRGTGPWYLSDHTPSVGFTMKRNPAFGQAKGNLPYIEQIDWPVVLEYAAAVAQFRTGAAYSYAVKQEEILALKRELPDLTLMKSDVNLTSFRTYFGQAPTSNFKDERVRQAWMMTQDRDLFLDAYSNVSTFEAEGVEVDTFYEAAMQCDTWKGWYLDPRDKAFGPNAKFFKKDVAEAKKLMAAAGFNSTLPLNVYHPASGSTSVTRSFPSRRHHVGHGRRERSVQADPRAEALSDRVPLRLHRSADPRQVRRRRADDRQPAGRPRNGGVHLLPPAGPVQRRH